jgi:hypothetical protein
MRGAGSDLPFWKNAWKWLHDDHCMCASAGRSGRWGEALVAALRLEAKRLNTLAPRIAARIQPGTQVAWGNRGRSECLSVTWIAGEEV